MLQQLADVVDDLIYPLTDLIEDHEEQIGAREAASRIERQQAAKAQRRQGGGGNNEAVRAQRQQRCPPLAPLSSRTPQVPGSESVLSDKGREGIQDLISLERNAARLLWGVNRADEIAVYDRVVRPKEYVRASLVSHFVNFTKTMFEAEDGEMVPPSQALKNLQYSAAAMHKCSSHLDIELPMLLREALFEQSCEPEVYDVAGVLKGIPAVSGLGDRNVHKVTKCYVDLVEKSVASGCVYAPATDTFVKLAPTSRRGTEPLSLADIATPTELKCLCLLLGTQGARALDSAIMSLLERHTSKLKAFLSSNERALTQVGEGFLGDKAANFDPLLGAIKGVPEFMQSNTIIGNALSVRGMLHRATGKVQRDTVPLINSALR
jgi:hypothetical protein